MTEDFLFKDYQYFTFFSLLPVKFVCAVRGSFFFVQYALTEKAHHATIEQVRLDAVQASFSGG